MKILIYFAVCTAIVLILSAMLAACAVPTPDAHPRTDDIAVRAIHIENLNVVCLYHGTIDVLGTSYGCVNSVDIPRDMLRDMHTVTYVSP